MRVSNEESEPELMCLDAPEEHADAKLSSGPNYPEMAYRKGVTHGIEAAIRAIRAASKMQGNRHLSLSSACCFLDTLSDFASDMRIAAEPQGGAEEHEDHGTCCGAATPYSLFIDTLLERFDAWLKASRREQERIKAQLQLPALTDQ